MKKLTVIIPAFNMEKHIINCIKSIQKSTIIDNINILLILGNSNDNTTQVAKEYSKFFSNIFIIYSKINDPAILRNLGIQNSTTDYITFVDCDDFIEPKMYETMLNYDADIINCSYKLIDENGNFISNKIFPKKDVKSIKDKLNIFAFGNINGEVWNKIYSRNFLIKNKILFNSEIAIYGEDLLFNWNAILFDPSIIFIEETLYYHTIRVSSITNSNKKNKLTERFIYLISSFYKKLDIEKKELFKSFSQISFSLLIDNIMNLKNERIAEPNLKSLLNKYRQLPFFNSILKNILKDNNSSSKRKLLALLIYIKLDSVTNFVLQKQNF